MLQPSQPVPAMVPQCKDLILSGKIKFNIKRASVKLDEAPINHQRVTDELAFRIYELGENFYGEYEVLAGEIWDAEKEGLFLWKTYSCGQLGVGFSFGHTFVGSTRYPGRTFSLKPPRGIDVEELCAALQGKVPRKKALSPLKLVSSEVFPVTQTVAVSASANDQLARAIAAALKQKARRQTSFDRCDALEQGIAQKERQLAARPVFESAVQRRLNELGF